MSSRGRKRVRSLLKRKGDPYYKLVKNLAESCSRTLWKIELASNEIGYLAKEISKQSIEGEAWIFFIAYSKMQ